MIGCFYVKICCFVLVVKICTARAANTTSSANSTTQDYPVATTIAPSTEITQRTRYEQGLEDYDEAEARQGRGMMMMDDYSDHDHDHDHDHVMKEEKQEEKAVKDDPWAGYYDFVINEGSFKFWAVFQLVTAVLLIYSAFAAVYYAKFNVITTDYDYYDDFFARSNTESSSSSLWSGLSSQTFQRIFDALSSKKYS